MIKIVATVCSLASPQDCREQTVIVAPIGQITMTECMMGFPLVKWMDEHPGERLAKWRCFIGEKARGI